LTQEPLIAVERVVKRYGERTALRDVSFAAGGVTASASDGMGRALPAP
jgi:ABC-type phosphonate transport system ATPase subunit